jgi:hypothetical protein
LFPSDPTFLATLQEPTQLFDILGSFWQNTLSDRDLLVYHQFAKLQNHADVYLYGIQVAAAGSIQQVTPFIARQWRLITLLESQLVLAPNLVQYGSGRTYGDGLVYGQIADQSFVWTLPEDIKTIGLLIDNVINPKQVFDLSNSSYDPTTSQLRFAVNPFTLLTPAPVYDGSGAQVDRQILLFARNVSEDQAIPYLRYGSIVKVEGVSSTHYVDILRAVWSMLVRGPSLQALWQGLLASAGLSYCQGGETVQTIATDDDGLAIVTDQRVYRFHSTATALVDVGDTLQQGQPLVDTIQLFELGSATPPDLSSLKALALGPGLCGVGGSPRGELIFPNLDGAYTWTGTDAQFTLYGAPADINAFWSTVAARGAAAGKTLAQCVGVSATSGSVAVNPMKFVIDNVFGNNVILILMKPAAFLAHEVGFMGRVPGLIPAGTLLLTQIELQPLQDAVSLASSPDAVAVYTAFSPPTEVIAPTGGNLTFTDDVPIVWIT